MSDVDLFVIGAGSGGVRASRIAAAHGAKVAVAEEFRVGGTCVIRGCVPKKLLIYGAHFAEDLADARRFGWNAPTATRSAIIMSRYSTSGPNWRARTKCGWRAGGRLPPAKS